MYLFPRVIKWTIKKLQIHWYLRVIRWSKIVTILRDSRVVFFFWKWKKMTTVPGIRRNCRSVFRLWGDHNFFNQRTIFGINASVHVQNWSPNHPRYQLHPLAHVRFLLDYRSSFYVHQRLKGQISPFLMTKS